MRCILCIRNNQWMKRHEDVRETEEDLIKQQQEEQRRKAALGKENKRQILKLPYLCYRYLFS